MKLPLTIIIIAILVLPGCTENPLFDSFNYPLVETSVLNISENGVKLKGTIINNNPNLSRSAGFVLGTVKDNLTIKVYASKPSKEFVSLANNELQEQTTYFARAFVVQDGITYLGTRVTFETKLLNRQKPVFRSVSPERVSDHVSVALTGKHFSPVKGSTNVYLDQKPVEIIDINSDTIMFKVPKGLTLGDHDLSLEVFSEKVPAGKVIVMKPVIEKISPLEGGVGTWVEIRGRHFSELRSPDLRVLLADYPVNVVYDSDTLIRLRTTCIPVSGNHKFTIRVLSKVTTSNQSFNITRACP